MSATIIKKLRVPGLDGQVVEYQFDAVKFGGYGTDHYAKTADLQDVSDRVSLLEGLSVLNLIDIIDASGEDVSLPRYKEVNGDWVALDIGDTIVISVGGYVRTIPDDSASKVRVEGGDMFIRYLSETGKEEWAMIQGNIDMAALRNEFATYNHKHTFTGSTTPTINETTATGEVTSTFEGTKDTHTHDVTRTNKTLSHTFRGTPVQLVGTFSGDKFTSTQSYLTGVTVNDHSYTPAGSVSVKKAQSGITVENHSYTPKGTIEDHKHTINVTQSKSTIDSIYSVISSDLLGLTGANYAGDPLEEGTLELFVNVSGTHYDVVTEVGSVTADSVKASTPFNGTADTLTHTVNDNGHTHGADFSGTVATIKHSVNTTDAVVEHTPTGSITIGVGTGTANYTPAGTIDSHTISTIDSINSADITPAGTVTSTFKGNAHTHTANQITISGTVSEPTNQ